MDEWVKAITAPESVTPVVTLWSVLFGVPFSALLSVYIGLIYRRVHGEASYSQELVHTFVLLGMITTIIMLVIGSNIARAFSLVGALSIIRFRTAIKSPLDVGFLFLAIAMGMACGTRFWAVAGVGTLIITTIMLILSRVNFGSSPERMEHLLSVTFPVDGDWEDLLNPLLGRFFSAYSVSYVETVRQGALREVVYSVRPKPGFRDKEIIDAVSKVNDNLKISYRRVRHAIEIP